MKIKIAVFGRAETIDRLQGYVDSFTDIEIIPFIYSETKEIILLIDKAFMCDVYVFLESFTYLYAKDYLKKKRLPAIPVSFDEYMILTTLYRLKSKNEPALSRLSIDVLSKSHVESVITELHIRHVIHIYDYEQHAAHIEPIIQFHETLWNEKKIDRVLTSIKEVSDYLVALGIPTTYMSLPKVNILDVIEKAKAVMTLNKNTSAQIVAGYIQPKDKQRHPIDSNQMDQLHHILQKFSHKTNSSVLQTATDQFALFGTRDILNYLTSHFRTLPLLKEVKEVLNIEIDVGFGFGLTAKQAEKHALLALDACLESDLGSCYIVNDRQEKIGPIGVKKHVDTSRLYQALIHKARLNNELSYNFVDFITSRNNEPFSSHDVALHYQVTKRSAERTINKLLSGDVIKIVGKEKPYTKGRPRKLFQINI